MYWILEISEKFENFGNKDLIKNQNQPTKVCPI